MNKNKKLFYWSVDNPNATLIDKIRDIFYLLIFIFIFTFLVPILLSNLFHHFHFPSPFLFALGIMYVAYFLYNRKRIIDEHVDFLNIYNQISEMYELIDSHDFKRNFNSNHYDLKVCGQERISITIISSINYCFLYICASHFSVPDFRLQPYSSKRIDGFKPSKRNIEEIKMRGYFLYGKNQTPQVALFVHDCLDELEGIFDMEMKNGKFKFSFLGLRYPIAKENLEKVYSICVKFGNFIKTKGY